MIVFIKQNVVLVLLKERDLKIWMIVKEVVSAYEKCRSYVSW